MPRSISHRSRSATSFTSAGSRASSISAGRRKRSRSPSPPSAGPSRSSKRRSPPISSTARAGAWKSSRRPVAPGPDRAAPAQPGRDSAELQALASGQIGQVGGVHRLAMATVLPRILREFHLHHPGIRLELTEMPTAAQLTALQGGKSRAASFIPTRRPRVEDPRAAARAQRRASPGVTPAAARAKLRLRDLAATPFVLFPDAQSGFYDRILAAFATAGVTPRIAEEVWPRANGIGLVRAGLGATFMTPSEAQHCRPR